MKYAPSALGLSLLSGSSGGTTASHNRNGAYLRARTIPVNPNTPAQVIERGRFADLSNDWKTLTQAQRDGWKNLGQQILLTDPLGVPYDLTGLQTFLRLNRNRLNVGLARVLSAPALTASNAPTALTIVADATPQTLTLTFAPAIPAGQFYVVEATRPVSQGVGFFKPSLYRQIVVLDNADVSPYAAAADYNAVFGDLTSPGRVAVRMKTVNAIGWPSAYITTFADIAA